ncbi:hypothetical protein FKM82_001375 [Ascaphus truei]
MLSTCDAVFPPSYSSNEVDRMMERHERLKPEMFAELLQAANTADDYRKCPSNCGQKIKIRRVLMNCPEIVTIGLVWDSDNSDLTEDVVRNLATQLYLPGLFFRVTDERAKESRLYLVGMICYTSQHYCAFAYHTKSARWVLFDDASVKEVGTKWKDVVTKCIRCHYQPLLLFYANPDGTAVSAEDALRQVMQWSHYKRVLTNVEDVGNDRSSSIPKKPDYNRDHDLGEPVYQNNGQKLQMDDSGLSRGVAQASAGRGPVKLGRKDQQEKVKDISRECAQRAADLKSISSSQRKIVDKVQKREMARPRELSGGVAYQPKSIGVQLKSGSPPLGNGFRQYPDQHLYSSQGRGPYKQDRPLHQSRLVSPPVKVQAPVSEPKQMARVKNDVSVGCDTDSSQEYREKGNLRNRKPWRPMRETLNVDSIFNENEKRQQSPRHLANSSGKHQPIKDQSFYYCSQESPKRKGLMTIYEDEIKPESGSRSSLESLGKGPAEKGKLVSDTKMYHHDSWQIQRTESGYESSDHISSGSSNLDSPVIEGTSLADVKGLQETSLCSDQQQPGSLLHSISPRTRSHLNGYNKEHGGLEHSRYEDRLSPDPPESTHRKQVSDSKREPRSPNLLPVSKDHSLKEMQMNQSDDTRESSSWQNSSLSENIHFYPENSPSFRETPVVPTKMVNTNGFIHSQLQRPATSGSFSPPTAQRLQYVNSPFFAFNENQSSQPFSRDYNPVINAPAPPLPPKKYARSPVSRTEQHFAPTVNVKLSETLSRVRPIRAERYLPGDFLRHESDIKKEAFHGNELHTNKPNLAGSSMYDYRSKMGDSHSVGLDAMSPNVNDTISLTTYFSVDNCMTDTYRLKYHQRPRTYVSENAGFHREPGHLQLTETVMEPAYHRTVHNTTPLEARSKPTLGSIPCNR